MRVGEKISSPGFALVLGDNERREAVDSIRVAWFAPWGTRSRAIVTKIAINGQGHKLGSNGAANSAVITVPRGQLADLPGTITSIQAYSCPCFPSYYFSG